MTKRAQKGSGKAIIARARKFLGIIIQDFEAQLGLCGPPQFRPCRGVKLNLGVDNSS